MEHVDVEQDEVVDVVVNNVSNASVAVRRASVHTVGGGEDEEGINGVLFSGLVVYWVLFDRGYAISRNRNHRKRTLSASRWGPDHLISIIFIMSIMSIMSIHCIALQSPHLIIMRHSS